MGAARVLELDSLKMPANEEAERSILGAILLDARAYTETAQSGLSPEDFHLESHRLIYRRMMEMAEASKPIDTITLTEELARRCETQAIGGVAYISGIVDGLPRRTSISHYVRIIKEKAQLRGLIAAANVARARAAAGDTPTEIASSLLQTILDVEAQAQQSHAVAPKEFMREVLHELELQAQASGLVGLPTGLEPLDVVTGGFRRGELIVIGAQPGGGKTALACQIVAANAHAGNPTLVFSVEMSRWDLGRRFLSAVTPVSASKIRHPQHITRDEWLKLATGTVEIGQWPVWFDDSGTIGVPELLGRARMFVSRMKAKLIVVDYLQIVRAEAREPRERVGKVANALRQLAKAERIPVLLLSQLRRPQNINDEPSMIDLKESGEIECHAHMVLLLHTPLAADGKPTGKDKLIIGKNRNGVRGSIPVTFSPHKLWFYPRDTAVREHQPGTAEERD
jgi:replicative DNA helicase